MGLLWTFAPIEDESPLGYYRRLSIANQLGGWKELACMVGTSRYPTVLLNDPLSVAGHLGLNPEWTQEVSRRDAIQLKWRGLERVKSEAVCPACLNDSGHIRLHWEHRFVTACHRHQTTLISVCGSCAQPIKNNRMSITHCDCGHDLRTQKAPAASAGLLWISNLIATGSSGHDAHGPVVSETSERDASKLIKAICSMTSPDAAAPRQNAAMPADLAGCIRYLRPLEYLLQDWPAKFEDHVRERIIAGDANARTLNGLLGPWYRQIKEAAIAGPLRPFLEVVLRVAAKEFSGSLGFDAASDVASGVSGHILMKQAAKEIGISRDLLLNAVTEGVVAGRTKQFGAKGMLYEVSTNEVERIKAAREGWISPMQACELLAIPQSVFVTLCAIGAVHADINWRRDILKGGEIEMASVVALKDKLHSQNQPPLKDREWIELRDLTSRRLGEKRSVQALFKAIVAGEVKTLGSRSSTGIGSLRYLLEDVRQFFGAPTLEAGMSITDLSKMTGWKHESISHWISQGLLEATTIMLRGQPCRVISPAQLLRFTQTYIPVANLAKQLGCLPSGVSLRLPNLEVIGAQQLSVGAQRGGLVRLLDISRRAATACR